MMFALSEASVHSDGRQKARQHKIRKKRKKKSITLNKQEKITAVKSC